MLRQIGFISNDYESPFTRPIVQMVDRRAQERGFRLIGVVAALADVVSSGIATEQVDGWLVLETPRGVERLAASGKPVITISDRVDGIPRVAPDNQTGSVAAVEHLLAQGRRRIAFVTHGLNSDFCERQAAYSATLAAHGLPADPSLVIDTREYWTPRVYEIVRQAIADGLRFDAVFCANDYLAFGVMQAVSEAGWRIPEDVAVIGFDDIRSAQYAAPPLSSVRQDPAALGRVAADLLLDQIERGVTPPLETRVPAELIIRASSLIRVAAPAQAPRYDRPGWQTRLARDLVRQATYPIPPAEDAPPESIWPGVTALAAALDAILRGAEPCLPPGVWSHALALTRGGDLKHALIELLRMAGVQRLGQPADAAAFGRLASWLLACQRALELEQARANHAEVAAEREFLVRETLVVGQLTAPDRSVRDISWLEHSDADWGALALWPADGGGQLVLSRVYTREDGLRHEDRRLTPAEFPPADLLSPTVRDSPAYHIKVAQIALGERTWGYLAYAERGFISVTETIHRRLSYIATGMEREELLRSLHEQSVRDGLTGLHNRRFFNEQLPQLFEQARRYHHPLSLACIDIDHFKRINDTFHHTGGDRVLTVVAGLLRERVRTADVVARIGGEEFVIVMPETALDEAQQICERLRAAVEALDWGALAPGLRVTVSVGVADDAGFASAEDLLRRGDARLYAAKSHGRNRVVASG